MNRIGCRFALVLSFVWIAFALTFASGDIPPELIGTWDFASFANLKHGQPFGTIHFKPGQWTLKLHDGGAYTEDFPVGSDPHVEGVYKVHGHDLQLKATSRKAESRYRFALEQNGKVLVLTDEGKSISTANRE
jgi:hypothetical protein